MIIQCSNVLNFAGSTYSILLPPSHKLVQGKRFQWAQSYTPEKWTQSQVAKAIWRIKVVVMITMSFTYYLSIKQELRCYFWYSDFHLDAFEFYTHTHIDTHRHTYMYQFTDDFMANVAWKILYDISVTLYLALLVTLRLWVKIFLHNSTYSYFFLVHKTVLKTALIIQKKKKIYVWKNTWDVIPTRLLWTITFSSFGKISFFWGWLCSEFWLETWA